MPLHDDEMNKRRAKREAQRRKQQASARRLRMTLALAVLVMIACGVGIYRLSRNAAADPALSGIAGGSYGADSGRAYRRS